MQSRVVSGLRGLSRKFRCIEVFLFKTAAYKFRSGSRVHPLDQQGDSTFFLQRNIFSVML